MNDKASRNHTPGPWKLLYSGEVVAADGEYIVGFHWDSYKAFNDMTAEYKGNCRLIAAAPELLEACKLARNAFERNDAIDWSILDAAIEKATGEPA